MNRKKEESLKRLNTAIKSIATASKSVLLENMPQVFYTGDIPGSPFTGDFSCHSWFSVAEQEVDMNKEDTLLQNLVRVRIENAIYSMIDLLEKELELLKKEG